MQNVDSHPAPSINTISIALRPSEASGISRLDLARPMIL